MKYSITLNLAYRLRHRSYSFNIPEIVTILNLCACQDMDL